MSWAAPPPSPAFWVSAPLAHLGPSSALCRPPLGNAHLSWDTRPLDTDHLQSRLLGQTPREQLGTPSLQRPQTGGQARVRTWLCLPVPGPSCACRALARVGAQWLLLSLCPEQPPRRGGRGYCGRQAVVVQPQPPCCVTWVVAQPLCAPNRTGVGGNSGMISRGVKGQGLSLPGWQGHSATPHPHPYPSSHPFQLQ